MPDVPSRSGSGTTDSAVSATTPEKAQVPQPQPAQPATSPPAQPAESADPSEAERARGTQLYQQGQWQVLLPLPSSTFSWTAHLLVTVSGKAALTS